MDATKTGEPKWEKTNVTNLLRNRQSGNYYARVKVNGKQKWRSLETSVFTVAKLKLGDTEKAMRGIGRDEGTTDPSGTTVQHFMNAFLTGMEANSRLADSSKNRTRDVLKAIRKTWPELAARDIRRLSEQECQTWATQALREGTRFIAPKVRTKRKGMAPSSFNKCIDVLRSVFELAREKGMIYQNPARNLTKAPKRQKRLELPTTDQFHQIVKSVATGGSRWSVDAADLVRLLTFSGARLREATALQWRHIDDRKKMLTIPGTKSSTSYRTIPLFPSLAALLGEIRERRGQEEPTAPIARVGSCMDALKNACRDVGVKPMNHHDLRHLFATRCIESGVDIPTVSRWLGHSDGGALAMLTYGHLRQEHSLAQAAKVVF